ncbi:L-lactate dehydrogenase [Aureobasidium sp. EXF-10727]|nr:L-lactate dehydrogenase [Aureobasidium sp. EXF-10727]
MTLRLASQSGGFLHPALTSSLPARTSRITKATFITSSYHFTLPINSFSNIQQKPHSRPERSTLTPFVRRMSQKSMTSRIAILGSGEVGSTIAYSLILNPVAGEILLVDPKEDVRDAQVQDLSDATFHGNTSTQVRAGTHKEAGQCDIVVITAGAAQKKGKSQTRWPISNAPAKVLTDVGIGESRTDLVGRNLKILSSAIDDMKPFREDTIIVLVSNPVDILTYFAQKFSGLPKHQVIGSGTFLDSARLRGILAQKCGVAASSIDAYVLGEHGDSQMAIGGVPLELALPDASIDKSAIAEDTKKKAAAIMESKGATAYGIGGVTSSICKSILFDQCNIRPISSYQDDMNVCLSMPVIIGRKGIVRQIPMKLDDSEKKELEQSAKSLREIIDDVEKEQSKE